MDDSITTAITTISDIVIPNLLPAFSFTLSALIVSVIGISAVKMVYRKAKDLFLDYEYKRYLKNGWDLDDYDEKYNTGL
jgi:hypothetical protein